jgi:hypothetical protein
VVVVYLGGAVPDVEPDFIARLYTFHKSISPVSPAGDFDADGFDDIALTVWDEEENGSARVEVYRGGASGLTLFTTLLPPLGPWSIFGTRLDAAGDVNGDGYDDLLVSEPGLAVYLYLGGASPAVVPSHRYTDPAAQGGFTGSEFAHSFDGNGDFDGDGRIDVLVGAPRALAPAPNPEHWRPGKAVVFFGEEGFDRRVVAAPERGPGSALGVSPHPVRWGVASRIEIPSHSDLRADIVDVRGRVVASLDAEAGVSGERATLSWDGRSSQGRMSAPGVYFLTVRSAEAGLQQSRRIVLVR